MSTDLTITSASLPERMEYARALSASNLLPDAFRSKPANALVAIEYGNALGIAPIVALSEINVINGTPSLSASLMAALARDAGHKVRVTGDAESATCVIVRADDPGHEHIATWNRQKAQDAGLWGRGHWKKDPGTMLRWRAVSECVRFACSEVLGGLKYSSDEVRDFTASSGEPVESHVTVQQPASRSGNARLADAVTARQQPTEPVQPDQWETVNTPTPAPTDVTDAEILPDDEPAITDAQSRKMGAQMREAGLDNRADALAYVGARIGREIESRNQLTRSEASTVIDALDQLLNPTTTDELDGSEIAGEEYQA